jgi:hypothetical protein
MFQIAGSVQTLRMPLRIACDSDTEIVPGTDVRYQITRVAEAPFRRFESAASLGIAPKRENVPDTGIPELVQDLADLVAGVPGTGEVRQSAYTDLVLNPSGKIDSQLTLRATCPIGNGNIRRMQRAKTVYRAVELVRPLLVFRGIELKRYQR